MKMHLDSIQGELVRREGEALAAIRRAAQDDLRKSDPASMFDDPQTLAVFRHAQAIISSRQRDIIDDVLSRTEAMQ